MITQFTVLGAELSKYGTQDREIRKGSILVNRAHHIHPKVYIEMSKCLFRRHCKAFTKLCRRGLDSNTKNNQINYTSEISH